LAPTPNPQSPIPNPQSPFIIDYFRQKKIYEQNIIYLNKKNI